MLCSCFLNARGSGLFSFLEKVSESREENENQQPANRDRDTETVLKEYAMCMYNI